jgi:hypothetical protein
VKESGEVTVIKPKSALEKDVTGNDEKTKKLARSMQISKDLVDLQK